MTGFKKRFLLLPLLSALWWGSCTDDGMWASARQLTQRERDVRFALSGFALSAMALVVASVTLEKAKS